MYAAVSHRRRVGRRVYVSFRSYRRGFLGGEPPLANGLAQISCVPFLSQGISRQASRRTRAGAHAWESYSPARFDENRGVFGRETGNENKILFISHGKRLKTLYFSREKWYNYIKVRFSSKRRDPTGRLTRLIVEREQKRGKTQIRNTGKSRSGKTRK